METDREELIPDPPVIRLPQIRVEKWFWIGLRSPDRIFFAPPDPHFDCPDLGAVMAVAGGAGFVVGTRELAAGWRRLAEIICMAAFACSLIGFALPAPDANL